MIVITFFAALILCFTFVSFLSSMDCYSHYSKVFKKLPHKEFVRFKDQLWEKDSYWRDRIVYFIEDGTIKISTSKFLHNSFLTYFDFYSLYWLIKYNNYFKRKVLPFVKYTHELSTEEQCKLINFNK